jgi:hypothetical protein
VRLFVFDLNNQGLIHADGQQGFNGNSGQAGEIVTYFDTPSLSDRDMSSGGGGGGGGGYGGSGGSVEIWYGSISNLGVIRALGGAGSSGGLGGSGRGQSIAAVVRQSEEQGGPSSGNGGAGGASETGTTSSQSGFSGGIGQTGAGGNVTIQPASCCINLTGNVDCDPSDGTDISDLSALIDNLYISFTPLCCSAEANTDGQPGIDISDLSALIDYLYISFTPPAACQ